MKKHPYNQRQRFLFWIISRNQKDIIDKKQAKKLLEESRELIEKGSIIHGTVTGFEPGNDTPIIINTVEGLERHIDSLSIDINRIYKRIASYKRNFYYSLPLG